MGFFFRPCFLCLPGILACAGPSPVSGRDALATDSASDLSDPDPVLAPDFADPGTESFFEVHGTLPRYSVEGVAPGPFLAGAAKTDITPDFEPYQDTNGDHRWNVGEPFTDTNGNGVLDTLWLGGFGLRQPTGVHDPLTARTAAFSFHGRVVTLTALDALSLSLGRIEAIKKRVLAGLPPGIDLSAERIVVASTHTHAAPDNFGIFGPEDAVGAWDPTYLDRVETRTVESILAAVKDLRPAELVVTHAEAGAGYVKDIDPPDIIDPWVGIVQARKPGGTAPMVTLASITNHPEALWAGNTLISADFPYYLRERIETTLGGMAIHFTADEGLMQTPDSAVPEGEERAKEIGFKYADLVLNALKDVAPISVESLPVRFGFAWVPLPLSNVSLYIGVNLEVLEGYLPYLYDVPGTLCEGLGCMDAPLQVFQIGDVLTFVTLPGEVTPELIVGGIRKPEDYAGIYPDAPPEPVLKDHLRTPERFVIGLAGCAIGYIFPKMTYDPPAHFSQAHGTGPDTASEMMQGLVELLGRVADAGPR